MLFYFKKNRIYWRTKQQYTILKADRRGHARLSAFVERSGSQNYSMDFRFRQVGYLK